MQSQEFKLPSGAVLHVTPSEARLAGALLKSILRAVKGPNLSPDLLKVFNPEMLNLEITEAPEAFAQLMNTGISIVTADEVEAAAMSCAERATYTPAPGQSPYKLDYGLLDEPKVGLQARGDFYVALVYVAKVNCSPFFPKALSASLGRSKTAVTSPA